MIHVLKNSVIFQEPKLVETVLMVSDQPEKIPPTLLTVLLVLKEIVSVAQLMSALNAEMDFS